MNENEKRQIRRHSSRKPRRQLSLSFFQPMKSVSSPNSPTQMRTFDEQSSHARFLWTRAIEGVLEHENQISSTGVAAASVAGVNKEPPIGWYNLTKRGNCRQGGSSVCLSSKRKKLPNRLRFSSKLVGIRVMQLNATPILTTNIDPAAHRENWQQRRYNFLSKNSMFGGKLKNELVETNTNNEQGTEIEQKPIITSTQLIPSNSLDADAANIKRGSILGMAVTGVRNLLTLDDVSHTKENEEKDEERPSISIPTKRSSTVPPTDETDGKNLPNSLNQIENDVQSSAHDEITSKKRRSLRTFFSRTSRKSTKIDEIHESYRSHRPYFTYWVTFVQIVVCVVSLIVYGHAPLASNQLHNASIFEQPRLDLTMNPWFGPYPADLIRLGAKYTPCIRRHDEVQSRYDKQSRVEAMSGCCIDTHTGRCMQTLPQQCLSRSGLVWHREPLRNPHLNGKTSVIYPAVCGLTPETCTKKLVGNVPRMDESSWTSTVVDSKIFKWSPNAVEWPVCLEQDLNRISQNLSLYPHLQCSNIARPCCTGVLGDCVLTSKDDCRRRRGIFHPRAHLCSQVDCIQSVCGMLEFFVARLPDQVYRFWTVIFIHAGLIHLIITIIFQYVIMRPLEKLAGCIRVMIIYIVSGFVGSLASALFLRDSIQVGPGGGQFAILACYLSELFLGWRSLKRPWIPFFKIIICLFLLFTVGLLPLVDNYSQCFGFLMGFMLNMIVFPDVNYKKNVRHLVVVTTSLAITIILFIVLITLFYTIPFKCSSCKFFECSLGQLCLSDKTDVI